MTGVLRISLPVGRRGSDHSITHRTRSRRRPARPTRGRPARVVTTRGASPVKPVAEPVAEPVAVPGEEPVEVPGEEEPVAEQLLCGARAHGSGAELGHASDPHKKRQAGLQRIDRGS